MNGLLGLFDKIFPGRRDRLANAGYWKTLTAYAPIFMTRGGALYESELVRSAIDTRARHISKLKVEIVGTAKPQLRSALEKEPNPWQSWSQFLYRTSTILDMQNTVFIAPIEDNFERVTGYFPLLPSSCEIRDYQGEPWLRYRFQTGDVGAIELSRCAVLTKFQYRDDIFGETNDALGPTIDLIDVHNQGIQEAVKNSASYRFWARVGNFSKTEDLKKERKRFSEENFGKDVEAGGILLFPNTYGDIHQIQTSSYTVDAAQMQLIRTNVYNYFGVNEDVMQNKAFGDVWSAFYEGAVETFAIQFSEQMTRVAFSSAERARGTKLMATSNRLQYLSNKDKLSVSTQLVDRGILNRDEAREIWNLPPIPDGKGQIFKIRGEYKDAEETDPGTDADAGDDADEKEDDRDPQTKTETEGNES